MGSAHVDSQAVVDCRFAHGGGTVCADWRFFVPFRPAHIGKIIDMKLANQVAIITGAGRNIGEDTAKLFASEGAAVAVVDMDRGRAAKVASAIEAAGGRAKPYVCDVSQEDQIVDTVKAVAADWGRLDILDQQCRDLRQQAHPRHHQGGLGSRDRGVPDRADAVQQICGQGNDRGRARRQDRQCQLDLGPLWPHARDRLYRGEGGRDQSLAVARHSARLPQYPRELRRAEQDRLAGRQGRIQSRTARW